VSPLLHPRHCEPPGRANARPMTGSAKQSIFPFAGVWIASSLSLLAMTGEKRPIQMSNSDEDMSPRSRGAARPSFASVPTLAKKRGRRESRVRAAPAVSCAKVRKETHTSIQVQRRQSGFPCAVVYGLFRALPGDRAFLPPSPPRSLLLKNLTPASGCQDHTASPSATPAFVFRKFRVHRISPQRS
jgi:hypothetical protein